MLDVSQRASQAINTIASVACHGAQGGLRISLTRKPATGASFALVVADEPVDGDQVVAGAAGSRVFLDHIAARCLSDQVLDVQGDDCGKFHFAVHRKS
ncbi:iron-sulfur cluster biosynthesis protein [Lentzea sp. NEAU-D7]|uniref:iron-sulfur cluster biosynthesis protein n=1 Tax=Lentzea sp. NEAU-D7 TaxID=2994667 RepID=UPI00224B1FED|nr:iron-sulfur cluster biosynthesis protein [Lentzea sp. NEAU-D7]MCX2948861.1 iron-sulfur cluster biosynthesis protein [Lentzea sp. NEAU-D7]